MIDVEPSTLINDFPARSAQRPDCLNQHPSQLHSVGAAEFEPAGCDDAIVEFSGTWEIYLASKSKKVRHEMKRCLRRTFEDGRAEYIRCRPCPADGQSADPRWDLFEMCQEVAINSWQAVDSLQSAESAFPMDDNVRDAHAEAIQRGLVDMSLLLVDGRPVAYSYSYCCSGHLQAVHHGYDLAAAHHGFGKALLLRSIADSFDRGDHSWNLGPLDSRLKAELQTN